MVTYSMNSVGLPVPASMGVSRKSLLRCLYATTKNVTYDIARLWARASNEAKLCVVSRAVSAAEVGANLANRKDADIYAAANDRAKRELSLLAIMGLVFPGTGPFFESAGYVLFPSDSRGFGNTSKPNSFGVLADGSDFHAFVHVEDLRWATYGINEILMRYMESYKRFRLFVHIAYYGVEPRFHKGIRTNWPLKAFPSIIGYWRVGDRRFNYPDHFRMFDPISDVIDRKNPLPMCHNWERWLEACALVRDELDTLFSKARAAEPLMVVPLVKAAATVRQGPKTMPYTKLSAAQYASLTGIKPYGQRGTSKAKHHIEQKTHIDFLNPAGSDFALTGDLYDGPISNVPNVGPSGVRPKKVGTSTPQNFAHPIPDPPGTSALDALSMVEQRAREFACPKTQATDSSSDDALLALLFQNAPDTS